MNMLLVAVRLCQATKKTKLTRPITRKLLNSQINKTVHPPKPIYLRRTPVYAHGYLPLNSQVLCSFYLVVVKFYFHQASCTLRRANRFFITATCCFLYLQQYDCFSNVHQEHITHWIKYIWCHCFLTWQAKKTAAVLHIHTLLCMYILHLQEVHWNFASYNKLLFLERGDCTHGNHHPNYIPDLKIRCTQQLS